MYTPDSFRIVDFDEVRAIVDENPFATLVTVAAGIPMASHLPLLLEESGEHWTLAGHMARANSHWQDFSGESLAIFNGPHGYVSPRWYVTSPNVPTWNYIAVHAHGHCELVEDPDEVLAHLERMVSQFDPDLKETLPSSMDSDFLRKKLGGLVAFRMKVQRWEGKAKLNQNKPEEDRLAVRSRYSDSSDGDEQAMARRMPS